MISISLCMIVKNEEEVLARCLDSVKNAVDEIVIVDTGSTDRTKEIAKLYTDKIYDYFWQDDFASARNFAFDRGEKEFLMWLDADDVLPFTSAERLKRLKGELDKNTDVVMLPYEVAFDENGKAVFTYYRERIVRKAAGLRFFGKVHEVIQPAGKIVHKDIPVEHRKIKEGDSERNLNIYEKMEKAGEYFESRALYYYGRELLYHGRYEKSVEKLEEFLKRKDGWLENRIDATRQIAACHYKLGNEERALQALLTALAYDVPRGETCCDLGRHFQDRGKYEQAIYWYKEALKAKKEEASGAFIIQDCYGFLPAISLCVCYDRVGDKEKAKVYNELAGKYKPDSAYYLSNKEYFRKQEEGRQKGVS